MRLAIPRVNPRGINHPPALRNSPAAYEIPHLSSPRAGGHFCTFWL